MSLATSRGSIGEYSSIVSLQYAIQQTPRSRFVNVGLGCIFVENAVKSKRLILDPFPLRYKVSREFLDWIVLWRVENPTILVSFRSRNRKGEKKSYKHLSSMILITERSPLLCNFGVGAAAIEPSPKKSGWSSHRANWAASRIVKGRTRTVTEMEDAPLAAAIAARVRNGSQC